MEADAGVEIRASLVRAVPGRCHAVFEDRQLVLAAMECAIASLDCLARLISFGSSRQNQL
jgi:hypothetical protein